MKNSVVITSVHLLFSASRLAVLLVLAGPVSVFAELDFGEPVKVANVNQGPPVGEAGTTLSPDGLEIFFHSNQRPDTSYPAGDFYLYVSTRESTESEWKAPVPLPFELNQGGDTGPSLSSDGLSLYFGRGDEIGLARGADIFVATRESIDAPWSAPSPVPGINANGWSDLSPGISADGLEIYFSSDRPGGRGSADLWRSHRPSLSDPWAEPENLPINTALWEAGPDLSPDGLTLFFNAWPANKDPVEFSDLQIWASQRDTPNSPWGKPERLPDVINGSGAIGPHLSTDGSTFYFSTSLVDTNDIMESLDDMDIWQVPVLSDAILGDFNRNGILDAEDIDLLSQKVRDGTDDPAYDLNGDRLVDVVDRDVWVHNLRRTYFGDSNLDGEFNSTDLVSILASGTYEQEVPSDWSSGDFDGNGQTDSADFVWALSDGGYELGPRGAVATVPEPSGVILLLPGLIALCKRSRPRWSSVSV